MAFTQRDSFTMNQYGSGGPAWELLTNDDGSFTLKSQGTTVLSKAAGAASPLVIAGAAAPTPGTGANAGETYAASVERLGGLIITKILVDLTGLVGSTTDLDIIGEDGVANANFGQITAALNGTIVGGRVTCLEVPAGGADDLDFYAATVGTGAEDVDVTTLTETVLVTSGGAWTSGQSKGMTGVPPANSFLYIVNGEAGTAGTFTAGKFLIELFGTP